MMFYTGKVFPEWQGSLFVAALDGNALVRLEISNHSITGEERYLEDFGAHIRDVQEGPDGNIYLLTDSSDGRILKLLREAEPYKEEKKSFFDKYLDAISDLLS